MKPRCPKVAAALLCRERQALPFGLAPEFSQDLRVLRSVPARSSYEEERDRQHAEPPPTALRTLRARSALRAARVAKVAHPYIVPRSTLRA